MRWLSIGVVEHVKAGMSEMLLLAPNYKLAGMMRTMSL